MSFYSSWIKVVFIMISIFLYCETSLFVKSGNERKPDCFLYVFKKQRACTSEVNPVCASNGRTYRNKCVFCSENKILGEKMKFVHYGRC
ncbi:sperm-associated acrosin inhibitor-like [Ochotona curzoniae]|uniref:sperm-associated acrosin inhibitor-like n=1 Tax=Ochotona curzoniae TaxID=130825 RepID=UPI001B34E878|nr:sperm-associated acrosin inhibitor-like [Ochotona curzoniae]